MLGFLAGGKIKLAMYLGIALVIAGAVAYHYWTVNSLNNEILGLNQDKHVLQQDLQISETNNTKLKVAIEEQKASLVRVEEQRQKEAQANSALRKQFKAARDDVNKLKKILSKHDLNYLSLQKPGLIERRINGGTAGVGTKIEDLTQ